MTDLQNVTNSLRAAGDLGAIANSVAALERLKRTYLPLSIPARKVGDEETTIFLDYYCAEEGWGGRMIAPDGARLIG